MRDFGGIQSKIKMIGDYGCYFLSIAANFKYEGDLVDLYEYCLLNKYIKEDCTVIQPAKIAGYLSGRKYQVSIIEKLPENIGPNDFYVECWFNKRTGFTHFRLPDLDTLKSSVTVKEGCVASYRYFKEERGESR